MIILFLLLFGLNELIYLFIVVYILGKNNVYTSLMTTKLNYWLQTVSESFRGIHSYVGYYQ